MELAKDITLCARTRAVSSPTVCCDGAPSLTFMKDVVIARLY